MGQGCGSRDAGLSDRYLERPSVSQSIRHAVSFHSSIARARAFKESQEIFNRFFPEYKKLEVFHVSGKMPTASGPG